MRRFVRCFLILFGTLFAFYGCATYQFQKVGPTEIVEAQKEIPEEELLDVGIAVFEDDELTEEKANKEGTHPDIRKAERHFIPYHLENTLQQAGHWGAVRVVPSGSAGVDLLVRGEILESNGERLVLKVDVNDATGKIWLRKIYKAEATQTSYSNNVAGQQDTFQDLYNTIGNDLIALKNQVSPAEIQRIRAISELEFAADFAPDAFGGYLVKDRRGRILISRLPADNDPMMERLLRIRNRDSMYLDVLNEYYDAFYNEMWPAYESWRKANLTERTALREVKRSAYMRQAAGVLMIALAVALSAGGVDYTNGLQDILILGGGAVIINGVNVSKEAEIHRVAIQELSESFGSEMEPVVMEFQGKKYELSGSAEEQYRHWKGLLRKIYYTETGFEQPDAPRMDTPKDK